MLDEAFAKRRRGESTDAEFVIVYCKMFLKAKFHANGTFDRIAARLVGGGHTQPDSSYGETFAPPVENEGTREKRRIYKLHWRNG
jgi:hypothetical protein